MTIPPPPASTVGNAPTKAQIDGTSGLLSSQIETWSRQVLSFKAYLDATTDEILMASPFNYSADNIATLKSAFNDLSLLANIYKGTAELTPARDLGVFSRRLAGIVL